MDGPKMRSSIRTSTSKDYRMLLELGTFCDRNELPLGTGQDSDAEEEQSWNEN